MIQLINNEIKKVKKIELGLIDFLLGLFHFIFVTVSIIIGLKLALKYFKFKRRELLLVGVVWITMTLPWIAGAINFLPIILLDTVLLSREIRLIISIGFLPIGIFIWLIAIIDLMYFKGKKKTLILTISLITCAVLEITFLTIALTDVSLIGTFLTEYIVNYSLFARIYLLICILLFFIPGILFVRISLKSEDPTIRLKGKFLLLAFLSFTGTNLLETVIPTVPITIVITRSFLILSSFAFYCGFYLPESIKKLFLKENNI